jgi:hypothetical protein
MHTVAVLALPDTVAFDLATPVEVFGPEADTIVVPGRHDVSGAFTLAATGQTPMQWLTGMRVRHAQQMLETASHGVERVGREVGLASPANFREQFRRLTGVLPHNYRNTFRERIAG